ncbi:Kre9p NDAI_0B00300 [Naumovozyma dairenensis CBS 421]|uniref:Uncharacterized protein n=1 Tax=Naumovozyma dairenensis (strain ATCC 10597 / BCRC 20456 / CBS 421 / NBRC 0211 / NRRL Y-12639) TaxID=1071378 RepID=G0W5K3_NAUDC|nr:hypothetical protein NDAI_0B00300 [Naumovozyma dairenensis CBS 421]CCD23064.1 hypothetical protein NDAI_0B00300 [Naumovozyma dairenensis CBS 421]
MGNIQILNHYCLLPLLLLFSYIHIALADVNIVSPTEGAAFTSSGGSVSLKIEWMDNTAYPTLDKISFYTFSLCTGPNNNIQSIATLATQVSSDAITVDDNVYSYSFDLADTLTGNGQYFIQIYAWVNDQGSTIHYTPRFFLKSMEGATSYTFSDTVQPVPQTSIQTTTTQANDNQQGTTIDSRSFTVPYTKQTGISRFAPMQTQPKTKISSQKSWTRKFQTSAVTFYSTMRKSLQQMTTITPGWSYTITSDVNYASPALFPSDNGAGYNPSKRLTLSVRKINARK